MTKRKESERRDEGNDLQDFLVQSIETLRASPAERRKLPALDRLLSRIETREGRLSSPSSDTGSTAPWARVLLPSLSGAVAGFAAAILVLAFLPGGRAGDVIGTEATAVERRTETARASLDQSIRRLERAVRGLENFQPLLESRMEWIEDVIQREHAGAYVTANDPHRTHRRDTSDTASRQRSGV